MTTSQDITLMPDNTRSDSSHRVTPGSALQYPLQHYSAIRKERWTKHAGDPKGPYTTQP